MLQELVCSYSGGCISHYIVHWMCIVINYINIIIHLTNDLELIQIGLKEDSEKLGVLLIDVHTLIKLLFIAGYTSSNLFQIWTCNWSQFGLAGSDINGDLLSSCISSCQSKSPVLFIIRKSSYFLKYISLMNSVRGV